MQTQMYRRVSNYFWTIRRFTDCARVSVFEVVMDGDVPRPGKMVADYETNSVGATKSARKTVQELIAGRE